MSFPKVQDAIGLPLLLTLGGAEGATTPEHAREEVLVLFDECAAGLRRYLRSCGLSSEATEDVLQDVFLSLYRHLCLGRPRSNLKAWLFRVGHNLALKQRQKLFRRQSTELGWDADLAERAIDPGNTPEEILVDDQRRHRLSAVLTALPERDRLCLFLRAEGLTYRDIASTLGVSLGSVAKSLARAMARLAAVDAC